MLKIRQRDPSIYDASTRLFRKSAGEDDADDGARGADQGSQEKSKDSKKLRDILYEQVLFARCLLVNATLQQCMHAVLGEGTIARSHELLLGMSCVGTA
jgi:hypothetical protein